MDDSGEALSRELAKTQLQGILDSLDSRFEQFFQALEVRLTGKRTPTLNQPEVSFLSFHLPPEESLEPYFKASLNSKLQNFLEHLDSRFAEFIELLDTQHKRQHHSSVVSVATALPRLRFKARMKGLKLAHELLDSEREVLIHTSEEAKRKVDVSSKETVESFKRKNAPEGFVGALLINNQLYPNGSEKLPVCVPNSVIRFVPELKLTLVLSTGVRTPVSVYASQPVSDLRSQVRVGLT